MKGRRALAALGFALGSGFIASRLLSSGDEVSPLYPEFAPDDFAPELFEAVTGDGLTLRGKRYPNPGATPVPVPRKLQTQTSYPFLAR
ncbi:MAG TPA: hypothetical protein VIK22_01685 [Candidatus Anoxymicrobiaceae bacterium]